MQDSSPLPAATPAIGQEPGQTATESNRSALLIVFLVVFIDLLGFGIVLPLLPRIGETYLAAVIPGGDAMNTAASKKAYNEDPNARKLLPGRLVRVITVKEGINLPRYPSVPGRLRAKRKPVDSSTPARPQQRLEMLCLKLPPGSGKQVQVLGRGPEAAPEVVAVLRELGLV